MREIPLTDETRAMARRIVWFEEPEQSLARPGRFLVYAMEYATVADLEVLRRFVGDEDFREALGSAPPGILRARSWAYWHVRLGMEPVPKMRVRGLPQARLNL